IIVTNQHVVANAERVVVTLPDGSDLPATVLGEDPVTDVAVLQVRREGLPTVSVGRSTDLMIGEWVVALGNPYAFLLGNAEPTVTVGVVSATGRNILPGGDQTGLYLDMIQTDAAINPGNSGGPLTNATGEVVGVNSSIFSNSGGSVGLGFAIPIERAVRVADEIIKNGTVRRAWVGLEVEGARAMREWKSQGGVVLASVAPDGPAARSGLRAGDVLTEANGRRLRNYLDWEAVKLDLHVGDAVDLVVRTGRTTARRRVITGDLPTVTAEKITVLQDLQLINMTPAIQAERGIRSERGALIFRISPQVSRATGLQSGDVILAINRSPVRSASEVSDLLNVKPGQVIRIYVERQGQVTFTDLVFR
ncbi:MAG TPA: trypsin-like peptidase domain-containing protein, partial [Gemmatimonadales bacterium]|nr:trypsin-like peptidase domain-containing protein [Gemmatimonadales bacterium]